MVLDLTATILCHQKVVAENWGYLKLSPNRSIPQARGTQSVMPFTLRGRPRSFWDFINPSFHPTCHPNINASALILEILHYSSLEIAPTVPFSQKYDGANSSGHQDNAHWDSNEFSCCLIDYLCSFFRNPVNYCPPKTPSSSSSWTKVISIRRVFLRSMVSTWTHQSSHLLHSRSQTLRT